MGIDKGLNPSTGEYVASRINHLGNAVYIRLATPLGSWWADPSIGSRLHELAWSNDVLRVSVLARQYAEQPHDGRLLLLVTVVDATGREQTFNHPVRVS